MELLTTKSEEITKIGEKLASVMESQTRLMETQGVSQDLRTELEVMAIKISEVDPEKADYYRNLQKHFMEKRK